MSPLRDRSPSARGWWLLLGGAVVFVLAFGLLETLVGPGSDSSETTSESKRSFVPDPPTVHQLEGGGVEIRHDLFRRTTIRLQDADDEQALVDCLSSGIEEAFAGDRAKGWSGRQVRQETQRVQDECLRSVTDFPVLPSPGSDD